MPNPLLNQTRYGKRRNPVVLASSILHVRAYATCLRELVSSNVSHPNNLFV